MYEDAQEIFNYLPIRRNELENEYISQLRDTFELLEKAGKLWEKDENGFAVVDEKLKSARPFALMPFHLLFMMIVQYKALRIAENNIVAVNLFFSTDGGRYKDKLISGKRSVFDISSIKERTLPEIFQLVGLADKKIKSIKDLVDKRNNNLAHANGNSASINLENSVKEYLELASAIQEAFLKENIQIANNWITEIQVGDDLDQFLEKHLFDSFFSPFDFGDIVGILLEAEKLDFDQWTQVANKGLELAYGPTIFALHEIAKNVVDDSKKFDAIRILQESGEMNAGRIG